MKLNPEIEKNLHELSGPECAKKFWASPKQIQHLCGVTTINLPKEIESRVAQYWIRNPGILKRRLRTIRYCPAILYCGIMWDQFDNDYPLFGPIALRLQGEGLVTVCEADDWDEISGADIILTQNPELVSYVNKLVNKLFWDFEGFLVSDLNGESSLPPLINDWNLIDKDADFTPNGDFEWQIRRTIHNMRNQLIVC